MKKNATYNNMSTLSNSKYSQKIQPTFKTGIIVSGYTV